MILKNRWLLLGLLLGCGAAQEGGGLQESSAGLSSGLVIDITPSRIGPNDGYTMTVRYADGTPYSGQLDARSKVCTWPANTAVKLTGTGGRCPTTYTEGPWGSYTVSNGVVNVPGGQNFSGGIYVAQYKPRGSTLPWSNFDALLVDASADVPPSVSYTASTIALPPRGSYVVMRTTRPDGSFGGYTRIDIETDDTGECPGGFMMRFTKSHESSYWAAGGNATLRWCVKESNGYLIGVGGRQYALSSGETLSQYAGNLLVEYPGDAMSPLSVVNAKEVGLLGGFRPGTPPNEVYKRFPDAPEHYALLPLNRQVPNFSLASSYEIDRLSISHDPEGVYCDGIAPTCNIVDLWNTTVFSGAGQPAGTVLRARYHESVLIADLMRTWGVTEDWSWSANGLLTQIQQWNPNLDLCWRTGGVCENTLVVRAVTVESYIPNANALTLRLRASGTTGSGGTALTITRGQPYELLVTRGAEAGTPPYSGFLEVRVGSGSWGLWKDASGRPIYVAGGKVRIPAAAYGNASSASFQVRPYLMNSTLNSWVTAGTVAPNASTAAGSNYVNLTIN